MKLLSVVEALEECIKTKDEFIVHLQDENNWLRAIMKEDRIERVKEVTEFKASRGYKSVHTRIRERVLSERARHEAMEIKEQ